jgi:hypothetical protein
MTGSSRVAKELMFSRPSSASTSRSVRRLPSMRVEDTIPSIVAMRRRALSRSGARMPSARQAPLNSSSSDRRARSWGVIWRASVLTIPEYLPVQTRITTGYSTGIDRVLPTPLDK